MALSGGQKLVVAGGLVIIVFALVRSGSHHHTTATNTTAPSSQSPQSADLSVTSARANIPSGGDGEIDIRLANSGPDPLRHDVTFTMTPAPHLTIRGPGSIGATVTPDVPFFPSHSCRVSPGGRSMSCVAPLALSAGRSQTWQLPVHVASDAPSEAVLSMRVSAVGSQPYPDPNAGNNTNVDLTVVAAAGPGAPPPVTTKPAPPKTSGSHPSTSAPTGSTDHKSTANKALAPLTIALWIIVGLIVVAIAILVPVARRQRKIPLDYVPPRRDKHL